MEHEKKRIALIGIIVEEADSIERMNSILHEAGEYIVGRQYPLYFTSSSRKSL